MAIGIPALLAAASLILFEIDKPFVRAQDTLPIEEGGGLRDDFSAVLANNNPSAADEAAVGIQAISGQPADWPFPHIALYGGPNSSGWPLVGVLSDNRPGWTEPLNEAVMNAYARFPHIIIPTMPAADMRPDILTSFRQRNPSMRLHAYIHGGATWCPQDANGNNSYPANTAYRDYYLAVTGGNPSCTSTSDRFLWMQDGIRADLAPHSLGINVNIAHRTQNPDASYRYDVAEEVAAAMYEYGRAGRNWDGIFLDVFCPGIMWMESPGHLFDYARAGYGNNNADPANRTAFDLGWQAGHQRIVERLRELAVADGQPDYPISGNCGQAPTRLHPVINGWMRENYPYQNGYAGYADFYSNNLAWPWGLLHQDRNFRSPQMNYIFTAANWSGGMTNEPDDEQYNAANQRKVRFGLASAAMGNGWHAFHESSGDPSRGHWYNWWYDEYAVNTRVLQTAAGWGQAMNSKDHTGWLGRALSSAYSHPASNFDSQTNLLTANQGFETASGGDFANWIEFINSSPANQLTQDTTTSHSGSASAKLTITEPGAGPMINLVNGSFPVTANATYTVTFWAKASAALPVRVALGSGTTNAVQTIPVDSAWRQYHALLRSSTSTGSTSLWLGAGLQPGTYWFDDISVQAGVTALWRRDFANGIVLVNPAPSAVTIQLEKPFRKILGTVNPTLNDGSQVTSLTLAGTNTGGGVGEGIFLLNYDTTAPASVVDLAAP